MIRYDESVPAAVEAVEAVAVAAILLKRLRRVLSLEPPCVVLELSLIFLIDPLYLIVVYFHY